MVRLCVEAVAGDAPAVLGVVERAVQEGSALIGRAVMEGVANLAGGGPAATAECGHGHRARLVQPRPKTIRTLFGEIATVRGYYHCDACHRGFAPLDDRLGMAGTSLSPGLVQACAATGMEAPYAKSRDLVQKVTGLPFVSASTINRVTISEGARARRLVDAELAAAKPGPVPHAWAEDRPDKCYLVLDGTGAPMLPSETRGRAGKDGGQAGTREVKIGCFFTQSGLDEAGDPVQDPGSVSYISTFEAVAGFAGMVKAEYYRRGFDQIRQPVILGDGAKWIWGIANDRFPAATQIVDYFHAREHLTDLTGHVTPLLDDPIVWAATAEQALHVGDIDQLVDAVTLLDLDSLPADIAHKAQVEVGYFTANQHRMDYARFRCLGYYIGSGSVESACNMLVKQRAKRAGMHWTIRGLDPVIALRTLNHSGRDHLIWTTNQVKTNTQSVVSPQC